MQLGCPALKYQHSILISIFTIAQQNQTNIFYVVYVRMNKQSYKYCDMVLTQGDLLGQLGNLFFKATFLHVSLSRKKTTIKYRFHGHDIYTILAS